MSLLEAYLDERLAFVETIDSLTDDELERGPTLCAGWAPRDVLAHLMGLDLAVATYLRTPGIGRANARVVERFRRQSIERLRARAARWATRVAPHVRVAAPFLLGDLGVHHQDVLRGLGRSRVVPSAVRAAILREGVVLGGPKLLSFRVVPDDGGAAMGRGRTVHGSSEALGLWLAGRDAVVPELHFAPRFATPDPAGAAST